MTSRFPALVLWVVLVAFVAAFEGALADASSEESKFAFDLAGEIPTVLQAIDIALVNGPAMRSAMDGLAQGEIGALAARSALLWRLDAVGTYNVITDEEPSPPMPERIRTGVAVVSATRTFTFDEAIRLQLAQADSESEMARIAIEQAAAETAVSVVGAYRRLELALIQRELLQERLELARQGVDVAERQAADGTLAEPDLIEARLDVLELESRQSALERQLELARLALAQQLGIAPSELPVIHEISAPSFERLLAEMNREPSYFRPERPIPWDGDVDEWVRHAWIARPEAKLGELGLTQAENALRLATLERRPVFVAEAAYTDASGSEFSVSLNSRGGLEAKGTYLHEVDDIPIPPGMEPPSPSWEVRLAAQLNLWDSGQATLRAAQARSRLDQAQSRLDQAKAALSLDVRSRYIDALLAYEQLIIQSERVRVASDRLAAESDRLHLGLGTPITVQSRRLEQYQALAAAVEQLFAYEEAVLKLAVSSGMSLEALRTLVARFATIERES